MTDWEENDVKDLLVVVKSVWPPFGEKELWGAPGESERRRISHSHASLTGEASLEGG